MKVVASGRQTGRTTTLIEMCHEAERRGEVSYMVCHSEGEARRIFQLAKELGKDIAMPITHLDFLNSKYHAPHIKYFYIDNLEFLLSRLTTVPIAAITITTNDE